MNEIVKMQKKKNKIIKCALHINKYNNKLVGTLGIFCYSFYTKHMTTGEGGMLCTNSRKFMMTSKFLEVTEW